MEPIKISKTLLRRLPLYLNYLKSLPGEDCNISATTIAGALGLGHVQVRKDLAKISGEGRRRTGRSRDQLIRDIEKYLDNTCHIPSVIVSTGVWSEALLAYGGFETSGLNVLACFDLNPTSNQAENGKPIHPMGHLELFCKHNDVRVGIIAVPAEVAQRVCDGLVACGVQAIWNFTPAQLKVPAGVILQNENLALSGSSLRMQLIHLDMVRC